MINPRRYGRAPFRIAVIHGGPGAAGEMAEVAERLSARRGVLEPLQAGRSLKAQVEELNCLLHEHADLPVTLIGFSWGAWLSIILAALHPNLVKKVILIGSGPFEEKYASTIMQTRLSRLSSAKRLEALEICQILDGLKDLEGLDQDDYKRMEGNWAMERMSELFSETDCLFPETDCLSYEADSSCSDPEKSRLMDVEIMYDARIYQSVWNDAQRLRREGGLMELCKDIRCPVVAIHGDWDPHPARGVQEPLERSLNDFRFILLEDCGHKPWIEKRAKERFYNVLEELVY